MSVISIDKFHNGAPVCWNWTVLDITNYVESHRSIAFEKYVDEDPSDEMRVDSFHQLIDRILLACLNQTSTYVYHEVVVDRKRRQEAIVCNVSFHLRNKSSIPISDVYSALGWFISYAEATNTDTNTHQCRHVCFTRLCYIIGNACEAHRGRSVLPFLKFGKKKRTFYPTVTHMLLVESFPFLTTDALVEHTSGSLSVGTPKVMASYSASLPFENRIYTKVKERLKAIREELISALIGSTVVDRMNKFKHVNVGICAETLTYASLFSDDPFTITVAFGQALEVELLGNDHFSSIGDIVKKAHRHPCEACKELFMKGRVTLQDIGTGTIQGPLPPDSVLMNTWAERNIIPQCAFCNNYFQHTASNQTKWCSSKCQNDYLLAVQSNAMPQARETINWMARNVLVDPTQPIASGSGHAPVAGPSGLAGIAGTYQTHSPGYFNPAESQPLHADPPQPSQPRRHHRRH